MADKQISELTSATTIGNSDLFVLQQGGTAKKLTGEKLTDFVYAAAAEKVEEVEQIVAEAQAAVDELEEQKNEIAQVVADMAQLGTDTTLSTPGMAADAAATGEVKAAALARFEQKEINGVAVATFDDGADDAPVKALSIGIEPVQSGSGDPSPTNVRPITGWTVANVTRTGKNLFGGNALIDDYLNVPNLTVTKISDESMSYSTYGQSTIAKIYDFDGKPNTRYTFIASPSNSYTGQLPLVLLYSDGTNSWCNAFSNGISVTTSAVGKTLIGLGFRQHALTTYINQKLSGLFEGVLTADDLEVYQGTTYPITFPTEAGTVYGGTLDVTNGVLTVNRVGQKFENVTASNVTQWGTTGSTLNSCRLYLSPVAPFIQGDVGLRVMKCNVLPTDYNAAVYNGTAVGVSTHNSGHCGIHIDGATTVQDYIDFINNNDFFLSWEIATPVTYTLTPTEVRTLLGLNNIWADTGNILDLIYRKEPMTESEVQEQIDIIRSAIATAEDSGVASTNYSIGALILVGSNLVEVTSPIAQGESIVIGSNCQETTVAAQIVYLKSIVNGIGNLAYLNYENA